MRACSIIVVAVAGLALGAFGSHRAEAMTSTSPAGLRAAIPAIDVSEPVHCRRFVHKHRFGHGYSRGCRRGVVVIHRPGYIVREGVIVRDRRPSTSINIGIGSRPSGGSTIGTRTGSSSAPAATSAPAPAATNAPAPAATSAPAPAASGKATGGATAGTSTKATGSATTGTSAPAATAPAASAPAATAPAEQKKPAEEKK